MPPGSVTGSGTGLQCPGEDTDKDPMDGLSTKFTRSDRNLLLGAVFLGATALALFLTPRVTHYRTPIVGRIEGKPLRVGDELKTEESALTATLSDGSVLEISPRTSIQLRTSSEGPFAIWVHTGNVKAPSQIPVYDNRLAGNPSFAMPGAMPLPPKLTTRKR